MDENQKPKLKIPHRKYKEETSVISVRMPKDMIKDLDNTAELTGRTRNEIMLMCIEYALKNLEITFD